ncbi:hypothetical protein FDA94_33640 [Herbidospora galbida]|uniref:Uncharacterized protein n=1 Tax=Herbidospora galbida TaxID=2575442 RepID=A0A4U3LZC9_9ACTN|nr:hypothetical protein [Herbidospora galbida]TKK81212.1 hypothetical protein FDA94_33640 [Herbidospora galbida]
MKKTGNFAWIVAICGPVALLMIGLSVVATLESASWVGGILGAVAAIALGIRQRAVNGQNDALPRWAAAIRPGHVLLGGVVVAVAAVALTWVFYGAEGSAAGVGTPPKPYVLPSEFHDTDCVYEVSNDQKLGAEAFQLLPDGHVDQEFVPASPYVWTIGVVVGWEQGMPDKLTLAVMHGDAVLYRAAVTPSNNGGTYQSFPPIRVERGQTYTLRVDNTTGMKIGVYIAPVTPESVVGADRLGSLRIVGEDRAPNRRLPGRALTGCVGGAERT